MDFAEFTLGFGESGVECGNRIGWTVEMSGGVDHFQWDSVVMSWRRVIACI